MVHFNGRIYISLIDDNISNDPDLHPDKWELIGEDILQDNEFLNDEEIDKSTVEEDNNSIIQDENNINEDLENNLDNNGHIDEHDEEKLKSFIEDEATDSRKENNNENSKGEVVE